MLSIRVGRALLAVLVCAGVVGCRNAPPETQQGPVGAPPPPSKSSARSERARPRIVVLGDSLSAGLGLLETESYPALLQQKLDADGYDWEIVNAGISGDTSAAGLQRLDWALDGDVRVLVLELGANDGLRGLSIAEMKRNLAQIVERAQARHIAVLLAGMEAPPNFGPEYAASFRRTYRELAAEYHVTLIPFLLDRVAGLTSLNQRDGIHPNPEGARIVADTVWTALKPMVDAASDTAGSRGVPHP